MMASRLTKALSLTTNLSDVHPSVTPIFQVSAFEADSPYFYTRKENPNSLEFENVVKELEDATFAISTTTGMSAINLTMELLKPGDCLVVNKLIYGCSYQYFVGLCERRHLDMVVLDLSDENQWDNIPASAKMLFFETPTNPFLKTINIAKLKEKLGAKGIKSLIVVDNTWATPVFQQPLNHGADISLHSATKFFSGHSDVMGGVILVNSDDLYAELKDLRFFTGGILPPFSAWLLRRSLQTLVLRLRYHEKNSKLMYDFLSTKEQIEKVYYPDVDGTQLTGYSGILFFEFREEFSHCYEAFRDSLTLFTTGTGMACVTSMIAQPYSGSHASLNEDQKKEMGIGLGLVRLCFGLEDIDDLKADIDNGLSTLL
jgi:cystathionine gamma-lyase/cystathionine gamma-lyase/homocysteine desulfhydrase